MEDNSPFCPHPIGDLSGFANDWAIAYVENQKQHHATGKLIKVLEQTEPS